MQDFGGASSLAFALIALLAVVLYAPTWVRERNARVRERNALRLQQTIRALAATSQQSGVYEFEANARTVRAQRRELKRAQRLEVQAARVQARAEAAQREAAARARTVAARAVSGGDLAARRRRGRVASTCAAAAGLMLALFGVLAWGSAFSVGMVLVGVVVMAAAGWMLSRINTVWLAQQRAARQDALEQPAVQRVPQPKSQPLVLFDIASEAAPAPEPSSSWTPVPLPKPLYLERATSEESNGPDDDGPGSGSWDQLEADLARLLREEAEKSTQALREAHRDVASISSGARRIRSVTVSSAEQWRQMGDVEAIAQLAGAGDYADLDALLRRRRAS